MQHNPELTQQLVAIIDKIKTVESKQEIHGLIEVFLMELTNSDKMTLLQFDKSDSTK